MYFDKLPTIYYKFTINDKDVLKIVKDITANVRFRKEIINNISVYDEYDLRDGETPEIIAAKYYGNPEYHWIIMMFNDKFNWVDDFPMNTRVLEEYIFEKYADPYAIHHYQKDGYTVSAETVGASSFTNYDYESQLNESKRRIKLISPSLLNQILTNFKSLI